MEKNFRHLLKELKENRNVVNVRVVGSTPGLGFLTGTINKVKEDHIILQTAVVVAQHMLPIKQIETVDF